MSGYYGTNGMHKLDETKNISEYFEVSGRNLDDIFMNDKHLLYYRINPDKTTSYFIERSVHDRKVMRLLDAIKARKISVSDGKRYLEKLYNNLQIKPDDYNKFLDVVGVNPHKEMQYNIDGMHELNGPITNYMQVTGKNLDNILSTDRSSLYYKISPNDKPIYYVKLLQRSKHLLKPKAKKNKCRCK